MLTTTKLNKMKKFYTILLALIVNLIYADCPDLKITKGSLWALGSDHITYALNISNIGTQDAKLDWDPNSPTDNVVIQAFLSYDDLADGNDIRLNDIILGLNSLEKIKAGEIFSVVGRDTLIIREFRYLLFKIDPLNKVQECSEENNSFKILLRSGSLTLEIPKLEGPKGGSLEIPVYGSDFYQMLGFQFSISFTNPSVFRVDSVGKLGLEEMIPNDIRIKNNQHLGLVWFSSHEEGLSFNGKKRLFSIFITLTGEHGECSDLIFDDSFLPLEFISSNPLSEPIEIKTISGRVCIQNLVECGGRVTLSNLEPIPGVKVKANAHIATTDRNGKYLLEKLIRGKDYTISAEKTEDFVHGLSVMDILLIKKHLLEIQALPTPYQIIAADVNGDLTITVQDIVLIRNMILGMIPHFGKTPAWQFIPKSYKFKNPKNPLAEDYPIAYTLNNLQSDQLGLDFIGIKTGDVSLDWQDMLAGRPESRTSQAVTLVLNDQLLEANREYVLPVFTRQFDHIQGFQLALHLDPGVVLHHIESPLLGDFNKQNFHLKDQILKILWYDSRASGSRFLADMDTLFLLHFKTKRSINTRSIFRLDEKALPSLASLEQSGINTIKIEFPRTTTTIKNMDHSLGLAVFPNPATESFILSMHLIQKGPVEIRVVNLLGSVLFQKRQDLEEGMQEIRMDTRSWPDGRYTIMVSGAQGTESRSVVCHH